MTAAPARRRRAYTRLMAVAPARRPPTRIPTTSVDVSARVDPARVGAAHQSLHHFVAKAAWDDDALLAAVRGHVLPAMLEPGPIPASPADDTSPPTKGTLA